MDLANFTLSMRCLVDEQLQCRASRQLSGDNVAALALDIYLRRHYTAHWRARHLRSRPKAFQERSRDGALPAYHVAGKWNPADLGTKPLEATRHWKLCDFAGLSLKKDEDEGMSFMHTSKPSLQQCIKAVVLACCLGTVRGQPNQETHDGSSDRVLIGMLGLIIAAAIALWEASRVLIGRLREMYSWTTSRPSRDPLPRPPPRPESPALGRAAAQ